MSTPEESARAGTDAAMREVFMQITKLPPGEVIPYMVSVMQISLELLRAGGKEDKFVSELLDAAREGLKKPCWLTLKDMRVN